jgi:hypothetical protein
MRPLLIFAAALFCCPGLARAQATPPPAGQFEGITLGEPMAGLKDRLGDPVQVADAGGSPIWRYLAGGGGLYIDVLVKNNIAASVTVVQRFAGAAYTDAKGAAFGMTSDQVRAKLGPPAKVTTNSDDGSVDFWYRAGDYAWVYEFYSGKLGFIQLVASPAILRGFAQGPTTAPDDGATLDRAIWIRPPNALSSSLWIDTYLAMTACGGGGHWRTISLHFTPDAPKNDPLAYTVAHASCTGGGAERDFYFDTHGTVASPAVSPTPHPATQE